MNLFNSVLQDDKVGGEIVCYRIKCTQNNRRYIGISCNHTFRIKQHFDQLRLQSHFCESLQNDYNLYGEGSFVSEIIYKDKFIDSIQRKLIEKVALSVEKNLYNTNKFIEFNKPRKSNKDFKRDFKYEFIFDGEKVKVGINNSTIKLLIPKIIKYESFRVLIPKTISVDFVRGKIYSAYNHNRLKGIGIPKIKTKKVHNGLLFTLKA